MNSVGVLRLELHCFQDVTFSKLDLNTLRVFLTGDGNVTYSLIELLSSNCIQIVARDLASPAKKVVYLSPDNVRQAGLAESESLIPFPRRSFWGYRLIQEYFSFPEKFLFLDISGFDQLAAAGFGDKVELIFLISDFERPERKQTLESGLAETTFALGCAPIVNLFDQVAEPVLIEQKRYEYRIVPDARREQAVDIFSVDKVSGVMGSSGEIIDYEPFYSYRHSRGNGRGGNENDAFYHISRRPSAWRTDKGSDVYISFVDLTGQKTTPGRDSITVRLTCSNRDLPARLPFGNPEGDFQLEGGGPIARIVAVVNPTNALQPPERASLLWRLVSQMSLNYLSIVGEGVDAFREILRLHNFSDSLPAQRQIDGILSIESRPHFTRLVSEHGVSFVRGTQVEIEFDEEQFAGAGVYSFCAMLDVFLGLYTSVNSFSQLVTRTRQRKGVMKRWPPRAGRKILI
jgi:type VI secretion system protein ImpG